MGIGPREKAEGGVECVGSNLIFHLRFQTSGMGTTWLRMFQSVLRGGLETSAADKLPPCNS